MTTSSPDPYLGSHIISKESKYDNTMWIITVMLTTYVLYLLS